jgi:hypothetical protein
MTDPNFSLTQYDNGDHGVVVTHNSTIRLVKRFDSQGDAKIWIRERSQEFYANDNRNQVFERPIWIWFLKQYNKILQVFRPRMN